MSLKYIIIHTVASGNNTKTLGFDTINLKCDVRLCSSKPAKHYTVQYFIILSEKYILYHNYGYNIRIWIYDND